jgi:hypothetical protein
MTRSDVLVQVQRMQRSLAVTTRLYRFITRHDVAREKMKDAGIERTAFECGYDRCLADIEKQVIFGEVKP